MSRPRPPLVSVVITVRNGPALARAAVESMLTQTLEDLEVVVVDDGSSDGTPEVLREIPDPRIRLFKPPGGLGRTRSLNYAVGLARADVVAIMDGDDLSFPGRLERQVAALRDDPLLDVVGARMLRVDTEGTVLDVGPDPLEHDALRGTAWRSIPIPHPTWCGRRAWFKRHPYRTWMPCSEDQEVLYRAFPDSRFACLEDVLVIKRERDIDLSTLVRRRSWFAVGAISGDLRAGRWLRAGGFALRTGAAAARLAAGRGSYDHTWRWSPAGDDLVARYELLRRSLLGHQQA